MPGRRALKEGCREMEDETNRAGPSLLITADELAGILRVSVSHVYAMAAAGTIPSLRIGRARRFELPAVLDALRRGSAA